MVRLNATGSVDGTFNPGGSGPDDYIGTSAVLPGGKILIAGYFTAYAGMPRTNVLRLNTDGSLDAGFVPPTFTGSVSKLLLQPNNRVLLGGSFSGGGLPANLARLLPTGAADTSFGATAAPDATVTSLLVQPDGAIVVGGSFSSIGGHPRLAWPASRPPTC